MHPRSFRGSARGWMDYDAEEILHHALAHHPGVHNHGKPLLTCEPIGIRKFFKQASSVKLVDVADPEKPTPLEEAAIPLITNTLKKQNPGSKLIVSFCRNGSNAKSVFYVKFDGLGEATQEQQWDYQRGGEEDVVQLLQSELQELSTPGT